MSRSPSKDSAPREEDEEIESKHSDHEEGSHHSDRSQKSEPHSPRGSEKSNDSPRNSKSKGEEEEEGEEEQPPKYGLHVSRLTQNVTDAHLREIFEPYGTIVKAYVAVDSESGVKRRYGFVYMTEEKDTEQAILFLNESQLDGREICVQKKKMPVAAILMAEDVVDLVMEDLEIILEIIPVTKGEVVHRIEEDLLASDLPEGMAVVTTDMVDEMTGTEILIDTTDAIDMIDMIDTTSMKDMTDMTAEIVTTEATKGDNFLETDDLHLGGSKVVMVPLMTIPETTAVETDMEEDTHVRDQEEDTRDPTETDQGDIIAIDHRVRSQKGAILVYEKSTDEQPVCLILHRYLRPVFSLMHFLEVVSLLLLFPRNL
eukprot:CAMPEP_0114986926 /NCGR_PEP_ID=MMETSP0216-20121206/8700_1 /TAXON_ID=223996 /ORGANISM="Protocruzia adherens, Strain Boccale" /LENGTH=370 /DNA_ID=CAMNT_0002349421 /DNA_START=280 /DNA_END=1393 /DNA_ORIENTATION=-